MSQRFMKIGSAAGTEWASPDTGMRVSNGSLKNTNLTAFRAGTAWIELTQTQTSPYIFAQGFQFDQGVDEIPTDATIVGIQVRIQCKQFAGAVPDRRPITRPLNNYAPTTSPYDDGGIFVDGTHRDYQNAARSAGAEDLKIGATINP